jgi:FkbM family methyltransferase
MQRLFARRFSGSRFVQRTNFTLSGTLNGRRLRIPVLAGTGMLPTPYWEEEPWMNQTLQRLLERSDGAFVDVGVNLGQTLLKVKTIAPKMRYGGFEPNPLCVTYVRRLIAVNGLEDCVVAPFGLSDRAGAVPLLARNDDPTDSSATVLKDLWARQSNWGKSPVSVLPGDMALASLEIGTAGVIKIDVEGAELEVVRGLQATLRRDRPHVVCEILPSHTEKDPRWSFRKPRQDALLALMRDLDYRMFRLLASGHVVPLDAIEPHGDSSLTNYAFVRPDTADVFSAVVSTD